MRWLERRAVVALTTPPGIAATDDPEAACRFVDTSLAAMPRHLRLGTAALSALLGTWIRLRHGPDPDPARLRDHLTAWLHSPVGPVRQYARLLGSLTLFAAEEHRGHTEVGTRRSGHPAMGYPDRL